MPMKTRELVHLACEVIILSVASFYFHKKLKKVTETVEELKRENEELKLELDEIKKILSSLIMMPGPPPPLGPFNMAPPIIHPPRQQFIPVQKNAPSKEPVIFRSLSPIEEDEDTFFPSGKTSERDFECDEEKCRLGISELQEEGSKLVNNDDIKDTATIIFSTIAPPLSSPKSTAQVEEVVEQPISESQSSSSSSSSSSISSSTTTETIPIPNPPSTTTVSQSISSPPTTQVVEIPSSTTENEKLKVIDPKTLKSLRKKTKTNGN
jgi:hypothetical protein